MKQNVNDMNCTNKHNNGFESHWKKLVKKCCRQYILGNFLCQLYGILTAAAMLVVPIWLNVKCLLLWVESELAGMSISHIWYQTDFSKNKVLKKHTHKQKQHHKNHYHVIYCGILCFFATINAFIDN